MGASKTVSKPVRVALIVALSTFLSQWGGPGPCDAYFSAVSSAKTGGGDVHSAILTDAIDNVESGALRTEARDVARFIDQLRDGSTGLRGEKKAHGGGLKWLSSPDGPYEALILEGGTAYLDGEFTRAYFLFGSAMHLIQDMTNPTHAFLISHGFPRGLDGFDQFPRGDNYPLVAAIPAPSAFTAAYYDDTIIETYGNVGGFEDSPVVAPPQDIAPELQSWVERPEVNTRGYWISPGEAGLVGGYGSLEFPSAPAPSQDPQYAALVKYQIERAVGRSHSYLLSLSKALPAVALDIEVKKRMAQDCTGSNEGKIDVAVRFTLQDNRMPDVTYGLTLFVQAEGSAKDSAPIAQIPVGPIDVNLGDPNDRVNDLPYRKRIRVDEVYQFCIPPGRVRVLIGTHDHDGNNNTIVSKFFHIHRD